MSLEAWIWAGVLINSAMYIWIGRAGLSKGSLDRPMFFNSNSGMTFALVGPPVIFILLVVAGFVWTEKGWHMLAFAFAIYALFAVKPNIGDY